MYKAPNQDGSKSSRASDQKKRKREKMQRSTEKPVRVYKLRPRVIGACHRRQLPVRSFIVSVKKKGKRENGPRGGR
ncbi:hypothetical protein X777_00982 [Ooceraea biroi]|uniref:Uncharacterized protein n=1 Tax=Ooceraea biroi TaxID=2015173 RepID=A0A026WPD4_OOCBI|nr:hypothetical protein X777_00982 [Ooceraea biroi]